MHLKLTKAQLTALQEELASIMQFDHIDMTDKLLICLLQKLYKKITVKLLDVKSTYSFKLDDEIALALWVYYSDTAFNPVAFADITIKTICNNIERQYA